MRKRYSPAQKAQIVLEVLKEEKSVQQIAAAEGVHPNQIYKWKAQLLEALPSVFENDHQAGRALQASYDAKLNELYAEIGRLTTQVAWLKKKSGLAPDAH